MRQEDTKPLKKRGVAALDWSRWLALAVSLMITAFIVAYRHPLSRFSSYGYLGIFVVSLLGNATVILPVPSLLGVFAGGSAFNPLIVGLVAGLAEPLGELTGYLAGYAGRAVVQDREMYIRIANWMQSHHYRYSYLVIFLLSAIPNPIFDLAGIAAGALRLPLAGFLISCWLGKTLKALLIAFAGFRSAEFIERFL